ncbi:hypothetical protein INT43_002805 [Umbelopsis isabellina]|uniref:50S ribosomal protein L35 n=1 Tax=Mortierella isabellina TaxID=91625 RepID=A0A8H7ULP4_MORIS|nr:hypothetical protein INT43_002805 [Umbelopsis isabellina]
MFANILKAMTSPMSGMSRPAFAMLSPMTMQSRFMSNKLKSHSGAKKRFFPVANGKFKRWQVGKRHINVGFSPERTNRLMGSVMVTKKSDKRMLRKALPYNC